MKLVVSVLSGSSKSIFCQANKTTIWSKNGNEFFSLGFTLLSSRSSYLSPPVPLHTISTTHVQHFFAEYLFSLENKGQQSQIEFSRISTIEE
jgi:hypothetical protein